MTNVRNALLIAAALAGLMFGTAGNAAACSALDAIGGLAPGFGNSCVNR
ncbi:hypothetical protein ABT095_32425 [Kitasatospora sp. NPDC002227]